MLGCILPSGNKVEFPLIALQLQKRKVPYGECRLPGGGTVFIIFDPKNLPDDDKGKFLPVRDQSGHAIYEVTAEMLETLQYGFDKPQHDCGVAFCMAGELCMGLHR